MALEVLGAEGRDAERWSALVAALPAELRDLHYLPEYGRIYRDTYGFEPSLAAWCDDDGCVIQPFVRRPLAGLPFLAEAQDRDRFTDIANAYGYGGPLCSAADPAVARALYARFFAAFTDWSIARGIASEFASLHPFFSGRQLALLDGAVPCRREKEIVYIDLGGDEAALLSGLNRGARSSVAKARRAGVTVEAIAPTRAALAAFQEIYLETMARRRAAERWRFPDTYFPACVAHLGPARVSLHVARVGAAIESAYLLMHDFGTAYYHFGGTRSAHPELRANNLLMFETARWAKAAGCTRYHLGGGVTRSDDDNLLRFKSSFSDRRATLYTYARVLNATVYGDLCDRKRAYERASCGRESVSDFFPLYRR